ncbi:MTH938/NDUFAF3 family protein [Sphingomonas naphthae]|uniref:MTH938/NDUFAF3 family protein n=1 Tax=Sphingomonas naphthae TaxID=1813468 RepID=A0ABY7TPF6_9SPHN|nr:MTH938/NDUFAF3 family protein [Sphingomonas naphthae]WCT74983.1 MTH938/NDUFAF3 family protein [Sphingomonas naphthae]
MPRYERDEAPNGPVVTGFTAGGGFKVRDTVYEAGLLLTPDTAIGWAPGALDTLAPGDLGPLLALDPLPEFILLGTGSALRRPSPAFTAAIEAQGIGLEIMDSRAAARAWGLLRGEGRWIGAALLPLV